MRTASAIQFGFASETMSGPGWLPFIATSCCGLKEDKTGERCERQETGEKRSLLEHDGSDNGAEEYEDAHSQDLETRGLLEHTKLNEQAESHNDVCPPDQGFLSGA